MFTQDAPQDPLEEIYAKRSCEASFAESIYSSLI